MCLALAAARPAEAASARDLYARALAQERAVRTPGTPRGAILRVVQAYRQVVRRYPASGYSDNALWQAAGLLALAYQRFGREADRIAALDALEHLAREYPSSSLVVRRAELTTLLQPHPVVRAARTEETRDSESSRQRARATLVAVQRLVADRVVRVTLQLDAEATYREGRAVQPDRLFFDFEAVEPAPDLLAGPLRFTDEPISEIRVGRRPNGARVAFDLAGVARYTVFPLYDPFRLVVDFERAAPGDAVAAAAGATE
ncbi:MAG TPA: AMIN domain-containing protein, partial [Vicinamibacterales bacterium]|nr:AMIN domain-containing protein [Vicinamibacterales bacterium]